MPESPEAAKNETLSRVLKERGYYLVRSCRSIPLQDGLVGYGWDDIVFCEKTANDIIGEIARKGWSVGRQANQIRRFKGIQTEDLIVVPWWGGSVAIGTAAEGEQYDRRYHGKDGCNQRRVRFRTGRGR